MRRTKSLYALASTLLLTIFSTAPSSAQLSTNPDKFLGNITTYYNVDYGNEKFYTLWNQITCENETKWSSVQGSGQSSWNWGGADNAYNYAKQHNFPFKFHTLVWGSQFPEWVKDLSAGNRYKAIVKWMDEIKKRYPDLEMIDVVNEAIEGHQADTWYIKEALGGGGQTGYDWIIKAFELAYERWPNAILIYNDFNTFQHNTNQFIDLVKTLRDAGAPIDAYGCQSHDVTGLSLSALESSEKQIQEALKMPMYITEYDIGATSDADQLRDYENQIPYFWQKDYCAGITLWGYIYGATWIHERDNQGNIVTRGISGLIKNGSDRSAMTWLRQYMATDAAKNAKSPFPGMKKEASVYIKPSEYITTINKPLTLTVRASMRTKTIQSVTLRTKGKYVWSDEATLTQAPFVFNYTPTKLGENLYKVVVTTTDGQTYERFGAVKAYKPRAPYKSMTLPGTIEAEDFDMGGEGISFHDSDSQNEGGANYRDDSEGVDISADNNGYVIGYTREAGEWLEYTVDVKSSGTYSYSATVASGNDNTGFRIGLMKDGVETTLATVSVPNTGSWNTYQTVNGTLGKGLGTGSHRLRFTITGAYCNIDKVKFDFVSDVRYVTADDDFANGTRYNLGGQRVNEYRPGLNIINGKKVYIME